MRVSVQDLCNHMDDMNDADTEDGKHHQQPGSDCMDPDVQSAAEALDVLRNGQFSGVTTPSCVSPIPSEDHEQHHFISRVTQIPILNSTMRVMSNIAEVYEQTKDTSRIVKVIRKMPYFSLIYL
jgi:hypothetical protein